VRDVRNADGRLVEGGAEALLELDLRGEVGEVRDHRGDVAVVQPVA
jgi:hypothetical protein